jgi:hypothetical protein
MMYDPLGHFRAGSGQVPSSASELRLIYTAQPDLTHLSHDLMVHGLTINPWTVL